MKKKELYKLKKKIKIFMLNWINFAELKRYEKKKNFFINKKKKEIQKLSKLMEEFEVEMNKKKETHKKEKEIKSKLIKTENDFKELEIQEQVFFLFLNIKYIIIIAFKKKIKIYSRKNR